MKNDDLIDVFFNKRLITDNTTKKNYGNNIRLFFKHLGKDYNNYFTKDKTEEDYNSDLREVYTILINTKTRGTIKTFFISVKQFFIVNDKKLKNLEFWDILKVRTKGIEPVTKNFVPDKEDLKVVLSHGDTKSRTMFLIMASTGCRIGELVALYPDDIDTDKTPAQVHIWKTYDSKNPDKVKKHTKTKSQRYAFLTEEAKSSYLEWMKVRNNYLKTSIKKSPYSKSPNDKRIFPMSDENVRTIWKGMVKRSGLYETDKRTNRLTLHPHCIRYFFRTYLGKSDLAEYIIGHKDMSNYYVDKKIEKVAEDFLKYQNNLLIFETEASDERINKLEKEVELLKKEKELRIRKQEVWEYPVEEDDTLELLPEVMEDLDKQIENVNKELEDLKSGKSSKVDKKKKEINELKQMMRELNKRLADLEG